MSYRALERDNEIYFNPIKYSPTLKREIQYRFRKIKANSISYENMKFQWNNAMFSYNLLPNTSFSNISFLWSFLGTLYNPILSNDFRDKSAYL